MHIHITPELEQFVQAQLANQTYMSVDDVFAEALKLLAERDEQRRQGKKPLDDIIAAGLEPLDRGEGIPLDVFNARLDTYMDQLEQKYT